MSSNAKIALAPSKPPALTGSVETTRTPLPMRSAARFRSASLAMPDEDDEVCWPPRPDIIIFMAWRFAIIVCSTVPLPSG